MKDKIAYKNCLIQGKSFQREKNGTSVPQYTLTRHETGTKETDFPSHQHQFNEAFPTENEADEYAFAKSKGAG